LPAGASNRHDHEMGVFVTLLELAPEPTMGVLCWEHIYVLVVTSNTWKSALTDAEFDQELAVA
jgi:hypothetical protein